MKIIDVAVCNPYQRKSSWYDPVRGHTGIDQLFNYKDLESPCDGEVMRLANQPEMGKTMYLKDNCGNIHVFAHLEDFYRGKGDKVREGEIIMKSGNTGSKSTAPHLHYEIITKEPLNPEDKIMVRKLWEFSGYNTNPIKYLKNMKKEIPPPDWIQKKPKPTFPVFVPEMSKLPRTTPLNHGKTNACTVFSVLYALSVMKRLRNQEMNLDPFKTHKNILRKRYGEMFEYNPKMGVSYREVFEYLKEQKEIKKYREISLDPNDWKIKIFQGYPVMVTIKYPHAVCLVEYDGDEFMIHDSLLKNPYRKLDREVLEAYIMQI
jgi:hypothetical protein